MTTPDSIGSAGRRVAERVARLRASRRLTYVDLARRLAEMGRPIPVLGLRRIEQCKRRVDVDDLVALAAALGADPVRLAFGPADACAACDGNPPEGFTCNHCGTATPAVSRG